MSQPTLSMDVRKAGDRTSIVDIKGDVTSGSEDVLMEAYTQASADQALCIMFNFSGLEYMNSGGIGLLVTLVVRANRQHQRILAFGLNEHYTQIFELTRLDDAIGIHATEADAMAAAGA